MKFLKNHKENICGSIIMVILFIIFPANRYIPEVTSSGVQVWSEDMTFFLVKGIICLAVVIVLMFICGLTDEINEKNHGGKNNVKMESGNGRKASHYVHGRNFKCGNR